MLACIAGSLCVCVCVCVCFSFKFRKVRDTGGLVYLSRIKHLSYHVFYGWVTVSSQWTGSGCQLRPCMLTPKLTVNMLIWRVPILLSSNPRHYITLRYITLRYVALHYVTLHYITLHYITLPQNFCSTEFPHFCSGCPLFTQCIFWKLKLSSGMCFWFFPKILFTTNHMTFLSIQY